MSMCLAFSAFVNENIVTHVSADGHTKANIWFGLWAAGYLTRAAESNLESCAN